MNLSLRGEMTVQFEAINPRTQELNFNKVRRKVREKIFNLFQPGAQVGPGGGGGEGDAPLERGGDGGAEAGNTWTVSTRLH